MEQPFHLRPAGDGDRDFLFQVFAAAGPGRDLPDLALLQFRGWLHTYSSQYPTPGPHIIEDSQSRQPLGFVWLYHSPAEHRIVDLALAPAARNRGLGAALIARLHAAARAAGLPMRASVARHNEGSLRFNIRNGARVTAESPTHWAIEWPVTPPSAANDAADAPHSR